MKRIALDVRAHHRGIQERQVEGGVVAYQHRASAAVTAYRSANRPKNALQRVVFANRGSQRMPRVDLIDRSDAGSSLEFSNGRTWKECVSPRA